MIVSMGMDVAPPSGHATEQNRRAPWRNVTKTKPAKKSRCAQTTQWPAFPGSKATIASENGRTAVVA